MAARLAALVGKAIRKIVIVILAVVFGMALAAILNFVGAGASWPRASSAL